MKDYDLIIPAMDEDSRYTILMALGAALTTAHSYVPDIAANQMMDQGIIDYEDRKIIFEQMENLIDYISRILLKDLDDKGVQLDEDIVAPLRIPDKNVN